jgi:hypothetical protein
VRVERRDGPTPAGGVYSEAIIDDAGRVVEVGEYDESGNSIARTYFEAPRYSRFTSETGLRPADEPREPVVTSDLLRDLGVTEAPVEEQRASVDAWLTRNEPSPVLLASLRRAGFSRG